MKVFPANIQAALDAGEIRMRVAVRFHATTGDVGFWSDIVDVVYDGVTFAAALDRFRISGIASVGDLSVPGLQITVSNADTEILGELVNTQYTWHQKPVTIYRAFAPVDDDNWTFDVAFTGVLDSIEWKDDEGDSGSIVLKIESAARDLNLKGTHRRTDNDQQSLFPGDRGFEHVNRSVTKEIAWGRKAS